VQIDKERRAELFHPASENSRFRFRNFFFALEQGPEPLLTVQEACSRPALQSLAESANPVSEFRSYFSQPPYAKEKQDDHQDDQKLRHTDSVHFSPYIGQFAQIGLNGSNIRTE
jgi:hypothetical protein